MEDVNLSGRYALVFGNEANGISNELLTAWKGENVYIDINNVESLSLTSAAAIALYKFK
jgi:tRNA G18 (ribose-2'-O)-methylase SpoU